MIKVDILGSFEGSLLSFNDFKLKIYQFLSNFLRAGTANSQFLTPLGLEDILIEASNNSGGEAEDIEMM